MNYYELTCSIINSSYDSDEFNPYMGCIHKDFKIYSHEMRYYYMNFQKIKPLSLLELHQFLLNIYSKATLVIMPKTNTYFKATSLKYLIKLLSNVI